MKIFLDFDDTLFDTRSFFFGLRDIFLMNGISSDLFQSSYQAVKTGSQGESLAYSLVDHIKYLQNYVSLDGAALLRQALAVYVSDTREFLYTDVEDFLKTMKKYEYGLYILSFGEREYQTAKIVGTGIDQYMEKNIITNAGKAEALRNEIKKDESAWFFDDRIHFIEEVKQEFPNVRTVLVQRVGRRHQEEPNNFCDYAVKDLKEGQKVLQMVP